MTNLFQTKKKSMNSIYNNIFINKLYEKIYNNYLGFLNSIIFLYFYKIFSSYNIFYIVDSLIALLKLLLGDIYTFFYIQLIMTNLFILVLIIIFLIIIVRVIFLLKFLQLSKREMQLSFMLLQKK